MTTRFEHLFLLMDKMFSLSRTTTKDYSTEVIDKLTIIIKNFCSSWRNLKASTALPKFHAVEDHLIWQIEHHQGIGDVLEDFIEQSHQWGKLENNRNKNLRNREKRAMANSVREWRMQTMINVDEKKLYEAKEKKQKEIKSNF